MENYQDSILAKAHITLTRTEDGGRSPHMLPGFRPQHVFEMPESGLGMKTYIGEILFEDKESIAPGDSALVHVRFLAAPQIVRYMRPGQKWFMFEAGKNIAFGEILEILP